MSDAAAINSAFIQKLRDIAVVAVIRGHSADHAVGMCEALIRGGVRGIELTFTTPDCASAVRRVVQQKHDGVVVGVGSVRTVEQVEEAVEAGASFAVSPHFEPDLVIAALETQLPYMPGALTPTEVMQGWECGAAAVKIFPANMVGPGFIKAVHAPLPEIPMMPTGGVSPDNFTDWLAAGAVAVGMGGNLVKGDEAAIEATARAVMQRLVEWRSQA